MKDIKDMKEMEKNIIEEYDLKSIIFDVLNVFGDFNIENYSPLKITKQDFYILFDLAQERFKYIKDYIISNYEPNSFGIFASYAFKSLFIGEYDLKYDNLNQKIDYFNAILEYADIGVIENMNIDLKAFIEELKGKVIVDQKLNRLFKEIFTNDVLYFIYLLMLNNNPSILELNEFIIRLVQSRCTINLTFHFSKTKDISHEQIINDLYKIFFIDNIDNNFHLCIENSHIKAFKFTNTELAKYINKNELPTKNTLEKEMITMNIDKKDIFPEEARKNKQKKRKKQK